MILFSLSLLSCSETPSSSTPTQNSESKTQQHHSSQHKPPQHHPNQNHKPNHPPPQNKKGGGFLPSSSPAEDLSSSWSSAFANTTLPKREILISCPDTDGDGFFNAQDCPFHPVETLDCDDNDPNVTPKTEIWIAPGPFIMGSASSHAGADEKPVHVVSLSGYCLDKTEVSSAQWFSWLTKNNKEPQGNDVRNISHGELEPNRGNHPAEGVVWQEAHDYCVAQGKTLPTEAQWEKAARGGCEFGSNADACDPKDLRPYPWGTQAPTCSYANHQLSTQGMPSLCVSDTQEVDSLVQGAGPYGHLHLSGNVWEFVSDTWHPNTYQQNRPSDPTGPRSGEIHALRGGGWNTFSTNMRTANRFHDLVMGSAAGFRCARSTTAGNPDSVSPLEMVNIQGTIQAATTLTGRALYVTAFDASDADPNGMLAPGRSPIAEVRLSPNGGASQEFSMQIPKDRKYILSAALDAGTGAQKENYISASGSGGFGQAKQNPISTPQDVSGITITLMAAPQ